MIRRPRQPEKVEQAHIVQLLRSLGAGVWVTGTRRPRGDYPGTRMTPGLPDVFAFLPHPPHAAPGDARLLIVEVKAAGGRPSMEQQAFAAWCHVAQVAHVCGDLDAVIAWLIEAQYLESNQVAHYRAPMRAT